MNIHKENFKLLTQLGLKLGVNGSELPEYKKSFSVGYMDLTLETLKRSDEYTEISLSQYYEQEGDLMADPDMVVKIWHDGRAEALTFQNSSLGVYHDVYQSGDKDFQLSIQLNKFLKSWLVTLLLQRHSLRNIMN